MTDPRDDDDHDAYGDGSRLRGRLESLIPNVIRRTVSTGVGAKQLTEDAIRSAIGDLKLPKEAVAYLIELADNTKREVVRVAAREFREFLESARFNEEVAKLLTQLSFEVRTEIRFIPNDQALKPVVNTSARVKSSSGEPVGGEAAETVSDAMRASATDLAEMFLGKVFRTETGAHAAAAAAPAPPKPESAAAAPKPRSRKKRKPSASGE